MEHLGQRNKSHHFLFSTPLCLFKPPRLLLAPIYLPSFPLIRLKIGTSPIGDVRRFILLFGGFTGGYRLLESTIDRRLWGERTDARASCPRSATVTKPIITDWRLGRVAENWASWRKREKKTKETRKKRKKEGGGSRAKHSRIFSFLRQHKVDFVVSRYRCIPNGCACVRAISLSLDRRIEIEAMAMVHPRVVSICWKWNIPQTA